MPVSPEGARAWLVGRPLTVGRWRLWPIESCATRTGEAAGLRWCSVTREPVAVLVNDGRQWRAIGCDGLPLAMDGLRERVPGLAAMVTA